MLTYLEIGAMIVVVVVTGGLVMTALQDYTRGNSATMGLRRRQFFDQDDR